MLSGATGRTGDEIAGPQPASRNGVPIRQAICIVSKMDIPAACSGSGKNECPTYKDN